MKVAPRRKQTKISAERQYNVIVAPHVTEKATDNAEHNTVVFKVAETATKHEIELSIQNIFGVTVEKVNTLILKGKQKRFRGRMGKRNNIKKAYVRLKKGESIDLTAGMIK